MDIENMTCLILYVVLLCVFKFYPINVFFTLNRKKNPINLLQISYYFL